MAEFLPQYYINEFLNNQIKAIQISPKKLSGAMTKIILDYGAKQ